jgi:hypothetical protein
MMALTEPAEVRHMLRQFVLSTLLVVVPVTAGAEVTVIRAGRLVDPETGTIAANQVILIVDIDAVRNGQFVMKNGLVFKKDGVMVPDKFFHPGPVKGWRAR